MKKLLLILGAALAGTASAQFVVRPWTQTNEPNEKRVAVDFAQIAHAEGFAHYAVPPMSDLQRLPDVYPYDGTAGGTVRIVAAKEEYEPGSFVVYPFKDLGAVQLSLGEFKSAEGKVFPAANLDLKVIKNWYQNGNGWYSYFGDTGFKLVPELLLNDENLIRTDDAKKANYARLVEKDGRVHEHWLNPPRQLCRNFPDMYRGGGYFSPMKENFRDADTLKPVLLKKGEFKQFFLTAHVTKDIPAGLYRGSIQLKPSNTQTTQTLLGSIPVTVKVLDFTLPRPMCYFDEKKPFLVNFYSYDCLGMIMEENGGDTQRAVRQFRSILKNYAAHNQDVYWFRWGFAGAPAESKEQLEAMRAAGFNLESFCTAAPLGAGISQREADGSATRSWNAANEFFGPQTKEIFICYGDEPPPWWLKMTRPTLRTAQQAGYKFILAGSDNVFRKAGYQYDWHNVAKVAEDATTPETWNKLGGDQRVAWYSKQHVGCENPAFNRRQNGLAAYLSGYGALCNYAHHFGSFNDDSEGYKPMVFAYGQGKGVIDTLQWEGFREGLDDIRYATLLVTLAREAAKSDAKHLEARYEGKKAMQFLAAFNKTTDDLNAARTEMIGYILKLKKIMGKR